MITTEIFKITSAVLLAGIIGCGIAIYTLNASNDRLEEKLGQSKAAEEILKANQAKLTEALDAQNAAVDGLKAETAKKEQQLAAATKESQKIRRESATTIAQLRAKDVAKLTSDESIDMLLDAALKGRK
jgi:hypothetical protein